MPQILKVFTEARKFGVALATLLAALLSTNFVPDPERGWVTGVLAVLGALGVYAAENKTAPTGS